MAQQTFLQVVNKVLVKLREAQVTTFDYSDYSALISEFVNDAKKEVENAWDWSALRQAVTFTSVIGTRVYDLSADTNEDSRLVYDENDMPMAFDITANTPIQLIEYPEDYIDKQVILQYPVQTIDQPVYFSLTQLGDGFQINFLETPLTARNYKFFFIIPQEELDDDADVVTVPWRPIRDLALRYALNERGEEIGEPGNSADRRYQETLNAAISIDAKKDPHKTLFRVP